MTRIGVVIPVGPLPEHQRWLGECLASARKQTIWRRVILLVDDMAGLGVADIDTKVLRNSWRLGVAMSYNVGIATAFKDSCDLALMLASDDWIEPDCLERIVATYEERNRAQGYYWLGVRYSDGYGDQFLPCHAAAVTPGLWQLTGGFSPKMAAGQPDAAFISVLLRHHPELLIGVDVKAPTGRPLYNYRVHDQQETAKEGPGWSDLFIQMRDRITADWTPAENWGRWS